MALKLPSVPRSTGQIPGSIAAILNPVRDIIEIRFLGKKARESVVTVDDLIRLGLMQESDLNKLDN